MAETLLEMVVERDIEITMRDGARLRANRFRPSTEGRYPTILTLGPYGKDVHLSSFMPSVWEGLQRDAPEIFENSSGKYMSFERPDPERWVPHGYVVIHVDSRGAGKSPGKLDANSPAEYDDLYDAIEWAGVQDVSNGKVGMLGISYYAASQWNVAALRPPHLAAILPWQGTWDFYRGRTRQGGIFNNGFVESWLARSVYGDQYGNPDCRLIDLYTGQPNSAVVKLSAEELRANRVDYIANILAHPLLDDWYAQRIPKLERIEIPALIVANWGGLGLHLSGTVDGFNRINSLEKWLKIQSHSYFMTFFIPQSFELQRRFFDRYLKGLDNGWEREPRVEVTVRGPGDTVHRTIIDEQWPLSNTRWTRFYLDAADRSLKMRRPGARASVTYAALSEGVAFTTAPLEHELEFAGPIKAQLQVSCDRPDMDMFATLCAFGPDGKEMTFAASTEPRTPVSQGWLRVTQRKVDPWRSTEYQPFHPFDEYAPLEPGKVYQIEVEIWAASLYLPVGSRITLVLQGKDFERDGIHGPGSGSGTFLHNHPQDRDPARFSGNHTIYTGGPRDSYLLLPVIAPA
ncbi:MAG TPA: CocE/NonD family hydrolase [Candidatus Binataceae bacterium]|nr:CocE/NonD family hydrolase [Candidatus Binataceae bacterium]